MPNAACRAAVPAPAERARSIVARSGPAIVAAASELVEPVHLPADPRRTHADGSISLLVDDDHTVMPLLFAAPSARLEVVVEFADLAPVQLREPTRGLLWVTGTLQLLTPANARAAAVAISHTNPDGRLLDVGNGSTVVSLQPRFLSLADGDGNHGVDTARFAAAREDPLIPWETPWLAHLEADHADVLAALAQHLPPRLRDGRLRPVGLDRLGMRMRVETATTSHDVRLPFRRPARTLREVAAEVHRLAGCGHARRVVSRPAEPGTKRR